MTITAKPWRDQIKIHPECNKAPLMKSREDLIALGEDIKKNGMQIPVVIWSPGVDDPMARPKKPPEVFLLAGRNRLNALEAAVTIVFNGRSFEAERTVDGDRTDPVRSRVRIQAGLHGRHEKGPPRALG